MNLRDLAADILDVRPGERRPLAVATAGAFLVMSFVIAARSLRDAFFLDEFSVETIPYMTACVAVLGIPAVAAFTRAVSGPDALAAYRRVLLLLAAGIVVLQAAAWEENSPAKVAATVAFYLWTALGSLLVTSGFWMMTAEHFELRNAKRLFGLIAAGGTLGAMATGLAMGPIGRVAGNAGLVVMLWSMLLALWLQQRFMGDRRRIAQPARIAPAPLPVLDGFRAAFADGHLRNLMAIVAVSTMASYLVDYQFKAAAAAAWQTDEELAAFFGGFYGLTGVLGLLLQVLLVGPLLARAGVGWALAVLPLVLFGGASLVLVMPGLFAITALRGADNALRRSVQRSVLEYLYVPLPSSLRRRTKALIDSLVDSAAEGVAALLVLLAIAAGTITAGFSAMVIVLAIVSLWLARRMDTRYLVTLRQRLQARADDPEAEFATTEVIGGEVALSLPAFDLQDALQYSGVTDLSGLAATPAGGDATPDQADGALADRLESADPAVVRAALAEPVQWQAEHVPALLRLLARDAFSRRAAELLLECGAAAHPALAAALLDEDADFVIRRRAPAVLARLTEPSAGGTLLHGLATGRFEVRYRCGVGLAHRRAAGMAPPADLETLVWRAIRRELGHERPIWELQRLLDDRPHNDAFVLDRVAGRGALSLEHTFRLLSLVLDEAAVRTAFHGVVGEDPGLRGLSLEYLEQVLPSDIRERLWPFIGDLSEQRRRRQLRSMDEVVGDLLRTGATLFGSVEDRERLRRALEDADGELKR